MINHVMYFGLNTSQSSILSTSNLKKHYVGGSCRKR